MCRSTAEGARRCGRHSVARESAARADRRRRSRLRADAVTRMGAVVDDVLVSTRGRGDSGARAYERHERFLRSLKATADTDDAIARLRYERLHNAPLHDPARAWVAEATRAGVASGDLSADAVRRCFEETEPRVEDRQHLALVLDAVAGRREVTAA